MSFEFGVVHVDESAVLPVTEEAYAEDVRRIEAGIPEGVEVS